MSKQLESLPRLPGTNIFEGKIADFMKGTPVIPFEVTIAHGDLRLIFDCDQIVRDCGELVFASYINRSTGWLVKLLA